MTQDDNDLTTRAEAVADRWDLRFADPNGYRADPAVEFKRIGDLSGG